MLGCYARAFRVGHPRTSQRFVSTSTRCSHKAAHMTPPTATKSRCPAHSRSRGMCTCSCGKFPSASMRTCEGSCDSQQPSSSSRAHTHSSIHSRVFNRGVRRSLRHSVFRRQGLHSRLFSTAASSAKPTTSSSASDTSTTTTDEKPDAPSTGSISEGAATDPVASEDADSSAARDESGAKDATTIEEQSASDTLVGEDAENGEDAEIGEDAEKSLTQNESGASGAASTEEASTGSENTSELDDAASEPVKESHEEFVRRMLDVLTDSQLRHFSRSAAELLSPPMFSQLQQEASKKPKGPSRTVISDTPRTPQDVTPAARAPSASPLSSKLGQELFVDAFSGDNDDADQSSSDFVFSESRRSSRLFAHPQRTAAESDSFDEGRSRGGGGGGGGVCFEWRDTGRCRWGSTCKFDHGAPSGVSDARARGSRDSAFEEVDRRYGNSEGDEDARRKGLCYQYRNTGKCRFGDDCKFKHGERAGGIPRISRRAKKRGVSRAEILAELEEKQRMHLEGEDEGEGEEDGGPAGRRMDIGNFDDLKRGGDGGDYNPYGDDDDDKMVDELFAEDDGKPSSSKGDSQPWFDDDESDDFSSRRRPRPRESRGGFRQDRSRGHRRSAGGDRRGPSRVPDRRGGGGRFRRPFRHEAD